MPDSLIYDTFACFADGRGKRDVMTHDIYDTPETTAAPPAHKNPLAYVQAGVIWVVLSSLFFVFANSDYPFSFSQMRLNAGSLLLSILAVAIMLAVLQRARDIASVALGLVYFMTLGLFAAAALSDAFPATSMTNWLAFSVAPSLLVPIAYLFYRLGPVSGMVTAVALSLPSVLAYLEWFGYFQPGTDASYAEADDAPNTPDPETVFAMQDGLLNSQIATLRPSDPTTSELFILAGAGHPWERVFRREVEAAGDIMAEAWGAEDRVLRLVNSQATPLDRPLLTKTNLRKSLEALKAVQGEEDITLMFLTSHGAADRFSNRYHPFIPYDLTPGDVSEALDDTRIGAAIIIVSACKSGSFVDELAAPNRLILTAASAERNSYGCSDENEWTGWGRAFFTEALSQSNDPRIAAALTQEITRREEETLGHTPSEPQIAEGAEIGAILDRWLADLSAAS